MLEIVHEMIEQGMGIKCSGVRVDSKLGEAGIGLDSQEIIEFTCMVEKRFDIKFSGVCFTKSSSIGDILERVRDAKTAQSTFEGKIETSLEIAASPQKAYQAIYEMEKWPQKLPHVKHINTLYNDGIYQEFLMDVLSETGLIQVRSIRRCLPEDGISFFQPSPPKFLRHHCGGWSFEKCELGCSVKTWHQWNIAPEKAQELFPMQDGVSTQEQVARLLLGHAELALNTWKKILETFA